MDLYIYNPNIELQGIVDSYSSLRWRRRFFEPGEVELHCPATAENLTLLREGNIIHRLDRQEAAIIEGVTVEGTDNGDEITATGRMGSSMLDRRIITPTINFTGTVEDAMRKIVSDNAITARPLPHLVLGSTAGLTPTCTFQATWKTVLAVVETLGKAAPLGFRVRLDVPGRQWIFEVYDGINRTVTQTARPYVLSSDEFRNITGPEYTRNSTGYCNYAIVGGEGEGSARTIVEVDKTDGGERRELWVDAKDLQKGDLSDADYRAQLAQRGAEKLAEAARSESFEAAAVDTGNFAYLADWDLGDIVSMEKWGIRIDQRITEVEEVDEGGVFTVTPVCGNPLPEVAESDDTSNYVEISTVTDGAPGDPGQAATIQIGQTTTGAPGTNASVENSGTEDAAVLNFTIPQGEQGIQGPQGSAGPQGPKGDKGATGAKGDKGDTGPIGPQGPKGDTGDTGPQGPSGPQGAIGPQGPAGADGTTPTIGENGNWYLGSTNTEKPSRGEQGPAGETGPQGPVGPKGEKGDTGATGPQGIQGEKGDKGDTGATGATGPQGPAGPGDMPKSIYDTDGDGIVDNAAKVGGYAPNTGDDPYGKIIVVRGGDGVAEVGHYFDFHASSGGSTDYDYRFTAGSGSMTGSGPITAPAFHGPADSAAKLTTARKINGIAFNGTTDITIPGSGGTNITYSSSQPTDQSTGDIWIQPA